MLGKAHRRTGHEGPVLRWAPVPVKTGAENLAPTGIRSPDRPAPIESLYRLHYPGPRNKTVPKVGSTQAKGKEDVLLLP